MISVVLNAVYYKGEHFDIAKPFCCEYIKKIFMSRLSSRKDMDIFWQDQLED